MMVEKEVAILEEQAKLAKEAGLTAVVTQIEEKVAMAKKLAVAMEHYRYVTEEKFSEFNAELKKKTERPWQSSADGPQWTQHGYVEKVADQLVVVDIGKYAGLPPTDVMAKVVEAKARRCFDSFEVAEIQPVATQVKLPDPIVFGRIQGCTHRFYIAEWGTDVSITDLIGRHEG